MSYRPAADNAGNISHGMTSRRRRRLAAWLLLGWAMFWLFSVPEPCCRNLAVDNADPLAAMEVSGDVTETGNPCGGAPQDGGVCQSVSVAQIGPFDATGAVPYRTDLSFDTALAAIVPTPRHAGTVIADTPSDSPLSGAPIYLRHQRLLI